MIQFATGAPPVPDSTAGWQALKAILLQGDVLGALETVHESSGDVFRLPLPGFNPVVLVGPEANRFVTVTHRDDLRWRSERDPVTRLLNQGLLVTDGEIHDGLRRQINPGLHKRMLSGYITTMWRHTRQVCSRWNDSTAVDMLVEMRRIALLIIMDTLFRIDLNPQLDRLWPAILRTLAYISPGPWILWPGIPRPGYSKAINELDRFFYQVIRSRRENPGAPDDLLGMLLSSPGMSDELIRDQLLTLLIAGHDTSTALLAWALHLLGEHPEIVEKIHQEMDSVLGVSLDTSGEPPNIDQLGQLRYLDQVINETLRLYPPIHLGSRIAARDLNFNGFKIPVGSRVVYSIYLTHRHKKYWPEPARFDPDRFSIQQSQGRLPYTYVPFGGGPRNCIGLAFAQVEVNLVLTYILQNFNFRPAPGKPPVRTHMGATLEPHPGVWMELTHRK